MKIILIVLGAILTAMCLLLTLAMPVAGIIGVLAGIGFIVWGIKYKKPEQAEVSSVSYQEEIKKTDRHTILVAGFDHHQKALRSLLTEPNWEYSQTKKEIVESCDLEDRIYEYEPATYPLHLESEPDNEYDQNAVKVFAGETFIGYLPRGSFPEVAEYSDIDGVQIHVEVFGGKYKYIEHDYEADYLGTYEDKYMKVVAEDSPVKAIIVFEW